MSVVTDTRETGPGTPGHETVATDWRRVLRNNVRQYGMLVALAVVCVFFQVQTGGILLRAQNVTNLVQQNGYILILAIGMVIVIISGHIDLSVGSIAAFTGAFASIEMVNHHVSWPIAVLMCLVIGAVAGAWQGYWIAYVGIPSFIVTLSGMLVFRGATYVLLKGTTVGPLPKSFKTGFSGFLPGGKFGAYHGITLILGLVVAVGAIVQEIRDRRLLSRYGFPALGLPWFLLKLAAIAGVIVAFTLLLGSYAGFPNILIILGVLLLGYGFVMRTTVIGRHVYAIGGNKAAARLSGVKNNRVVFLVFLNMGILSALAGLVAAARLGAGAPNAGLNFELEAIAAAFVGGASASGGVGTVLGAVIGGVLIGVLNNGMNLINVSTDWQQIVKGLVLLAAVWFDVYNKKKAGG